MAISHVFSNQIADGTNTNIVRPSDWNSAHIQHYTLSGNTLGVSTVSGTNVVFEGAGNVSLSGTGRTIVVYATGGGGGVAVSAGTQSVSTGTINFADSNGVTFGMDGSNQITASVAGGGAMYVDLSGNTDGNTTASGNTLNFSGVNITLSGTNDSQIVISAPPVSFLSAGNNISISNTGNTIGISAIAQTQASGNIAGAGFTSATTAGTAIVGTNNSLGLSLGIPAYLTAASGGGGMYANLSGNTSGNTTASGNTLNFSGINITLSGTNGSQIAISAPATSGITNGNNITITTSGSTIGISAQAVAAAAGSQTATSGTVIFSNSNGISFGMSGSNQITASHNGITSQSVQTQASGGIAGTNTSGNNASLTLNSNGLTISVAAPGAANYSIGVSNLGNTAGATGITGTRIVFVGTNNISLSQATDANGATISFNQTGGGGGVAIGASTQTATSGTVAFANSNGISFGMSGSNQITASHNGITTQTVQTQASGNIAGLGFSSTTTAGTAIVGTHNSLGLSLGVPAYLTTQSVQTQASGAIAGTGFTSATTAGSVITAALGTNGLNMGIPAYLTAAAGAGMYANLSGNTSGNTTASGSTLNFSGINITLSGTNGSQIAISAPATSSLVAGNNISISTNGSTISVLAQAVAIGASTQTATSGTVNFANSNGITFGMSGSNQITASHNGITTQSVQTQASGNIAGAGFTSATTAGTAIVGTHNSLGLSLGVPAYLTAAVGAGNAIAVAGGTNGGTAAAGTVIFSSANQITFGFDTASSVITGAYAFILSAGTTNAAARQLSFSNANGVSFELSTGVTNAAVHTIIASVATSLTNVNVSAGTTSNNLSNLVFSNSNGVSFGINGSTITASAAGGGGAINFSAGTTSNNLQTVVFSNSNGVSFGLNGSTITANVAPQYTLSGYNHYNDAIYSGGTVGQGSLIFDHIDLENPVQFNKYGAILLISNATNSTGSHTVSMSIGLYTQNGSTMSLLGSTSTSIVATLSGTVGNYSLYSGIKQVTIPYTTTLSRGAYFLGVISSSSSAGQNATFNQCRQSALNSNYNGLFGVSVATSNQLFLGVGFYSTTTTAFPGSIAFSQIRGTNADMFRPPVIIFQSDIA